MRQIITLTTDFGLEDPYVGVVKGVILGINPNAMIVDLSHQIPPQDVPAGAFALYSSYAYFPSDTIHLAVVDPGVGSDRAMLAMETERGIFIGPDNGLLSWAVRVGDQSESSPPHATPMLRCVQLTNRRYWLPKLSTTFHGRDIFAPVAAHLSLGKPLSEFGAEKGNPVQLLWPSIRSDSHGTAASAGLGSQKIIATVIAIDHFGNLITNMPGDAVNWDLALTLVEVAGHTIMGLSHSYTGSGLVALIGSADLLEIALPGGNAAKFLGMDRGATLTLGPMEGIPAEGC